jgi:hypothetical protein
MRKIENAGVKGFIFISEDYPDEHVLVKIVEINHAKGVEKGIPMYASTSSDELYEFAREEGIRNETIGVDGLNLHPMFGGLW